MGEHDQFAQVTKRLKTSSAVVPALLLSVICVPVGSIGAQFSDPPLAYIFLLLTIVPPLLAALQIIFFTFFDRDRLQNEDHVERKMLLRRMTPEIGDAHSIIEMSGNQKIIENPSAKGTPDV